MVFIKKITLLLLIVISIATLTACSVKKTDGNKFLEEYKSLNNKKNEHEKKYRNVNFSKENHFTYSTIEEINKKIDNKETFLVYFGFKECPWCRLVIEQMVKASLDQGVEKIYYVNIKDIRDIKEYKENKIVTIKEGKKEYYEVRDKLSNILDDYILKTDKEELNTNTKRIYAPNLIGIVNGKGYKLTTGIKELSKDPYKPMTKKEKKYAYNSFTCVMKCVQDNQKVCKKDSYC